MAIIPIYRVITTQYAIDATTTMEAGTVVELDSDGKVIKATGNEAGGAGRPIGLAAGRNRASEAYEWVNRVSDSGNDTRASGKMAVYSGVGSEFFVDVDDSAITTPAGTSISGIVKSTAATTVNTIYYALTGQLVDSSERADASDTPVAQVTAAAAAIETGIPDEYEPGSSVDYVDDAVNRTYVKIKLLV